MKIMVLIIQKNAPKFDSLDKTESTTNLVEST